MALAVLVVAGIIWRLPRTPNERSRMTAIAAGLVVVQTGFLFFAGVGIASYSTPFFQTTPAISQLQATVGSALVGLNGGNVTNVRSFRDVGFYPNVNIGYSIRIFGIHDPLIPATYFESWPLRAAAPNARGVGLFVPDVNTVALARRYGVSYVLTRAGIPVPAGMQTVAVIAGETLSKVPNSSQFSFVQGGSDQVVASSTNGDGTWQITTRGTTPGELALRVTALPGFRATIDNKPLALHSYDTVMLEARVPAGEHRIVLRYLPHRLELGLIAAVLGFAVIIGLAAYGLFTRRRTTRRHVATTAGSDQVQV
jgi:hypothetical protein